MDKPVQWKTNLKKEGEKMRSEESKKRAQASRDRYDKEFTRKITLKLNKKTDADVLEWLDRQINKQGKLKEMIREEIQNER